MKPSLALSVLVLGIIGYGLLITPFTAYMAAKPIEEKLGYIPSVPVVKALAADQKELAAASLVMKVLMYYGGLLGKAQEGRLLASPPDLPGMSRILHGAVQLDPYNMDAYYFAQAFLTWDAHQFKIANDLLEYGMKYRTWDWYLPFFAGFNYAYFLKDYAKAAHYYQLAGALSGQELYKSLAGRYLQASGRTDLAIAYLTAMDRQEPNPVLKKSYEIRLQAFYEVRRIEQARDHFRAAHQGHRPADLAQLEQAGYLSPAPVDPYGGRFYLQPDGTVATTSKFAFATRNK